jgi:hypothetical protein
MGAMETFLPKGVGTADAHSLLIFVPRFVPRFVEKMGELQKREGRNAKLRPPLGVPAIGSPLASKI